MQGPALRARRGRGALRRAAREAARLARAGGRQLRQHPRRARASARRAPHSSWREFGRLDALLERAARGQAEARARGAARAAATRRCSRASSRACAPICRVAFSRERMRAARARPRGARSRSFEELEFKRQLEELGGGAPRTPDAAARSTSAWSRRAPRATPSSRGASRPARARALLRARARRRDGRASCVGIALAAERHARPSSSTLRRPASASALERAAAAARAIPRAPGSDTTQARCVALGRRGIALRGHAVRHRASRRYVVDPAQQVERPEALRAHYLGSPRRPSRGRARSARAPSAGRSPASPRTELAAFFGARHGERARARRPRSRRELEPTGQLALYRELEVPLIPVLARMELAGVRIDEALLARLSGGLGTRARALRGCASTRSPAEPFNIDSPKQLQHVLFEKLALPPTQEDQDRLLDRRVGARGARHGLRAARRDPRVPASWPSSRAPTSMRCRRW